MLKQVGNTTVFVRDKYTNHFTPTPRALPARQAHASALDIYRLFRALPDSAGGAHDQSVR